MFIDQQCTIALAYVSRCLDGCLCHFFTHTFTHIFTFYVFFYVEFPVARRSKYTDLQSRRVTINLENGQVKTFWYAYVLDILLRLYTRTYPRKLEVK